MSEKRAPRGRLYLCATPIGNLRDITLRTLEVLGSVDVVAAEDTRRTRRLLDHHGISARLVSYREENREKAGRRLLERLESGEHVALVSDAGTPGISDPGSHLVGMCLESSIEVEALPGPNAALTALVVSGLPTGRFAFEGFLPRKGGPRRRALEALKDDTRTLIFYESPSRVYETLSDIGEVLGDRRIALARELTKKFEEVVRGTVSRVREAVSGREPKGEYVVVVEGASGVRSASMEDAAREVGALMERGLSLKEAVGRVASLSPGLSRRELYNRVLKDRE